MATTEHTVNGSTWTLLRRNNTSDVVRFPLETINVGAQLADTTTNSAPVTLNNSFSMPARRQRTIRAPANSYIWIKSLNPAVNKSLTYLIGDNLVE